MCRLIIPVPNSQRRRDIGIKSCSFVFRQFVKERGKPLRRLKRRRTSKHRGKAAVLIRACRSAYEISGFSGFDQAFTLIELLVLIVTVGLLSLVLVTGLARTYPNTKSVECLNNLRQLTLAWQQYAVDSQDILSTCQNYGYGILSGRTNWLDGILDFSSARGNWDPAIYIQTSPMFPYCGRNALLFRCPADKSTVVATNRVRLPRVRSHSMSQAFSLGEWLDNYGNLGQETRVWHLYNKLSTILVPAKTFVFIDEHPDSINDAGFGSACTGNQPGDPPSVSQIIDFPSNYHSGGCAISFADGHCQIHK